MTQRYLYLFLGAVLACLYGCGGGDAGVALRNPVFYDHATIGADLASQFEKRFPKLDLEERDPNPAYLGVEVLDGKVRVSRPSNWKVRAASDRPGVRHIQYLSPRGYIFGVYERQELPDALWSDVIARYEESLKANRAEVLQAAVPMATANAQGRAFLVRRRVPAAKTPFVNESREYLIRGERGIMHVQIVLPPDGPAGISMEMRRVIDTFTLL